MEGDARHWRRQRNEKGGAVICTSHRILRGSYNTAQWERRGCDLCRRKEKCIPDFAGKTWRKESLGKPRRIRQILKQILEKQEGKAWTGLMWLRIWTRGGLLWTRQWTFEFHITAVISWLAEELLASQEGLCCTDFVTSLVGYLHVCFARHLAHRSTVATDYIFLVQSITTTAGIKFTTKRQTLRVLSCGSQVSSKSPAYETTKGHVLKILPFPRKYFRSLTHPRSSSQTRHFKYARWTGFRRKPKPVGNETYRCLSNWAPRAFRVCTAC